MMESVSFLRKFINSPSSIGSVVPSSPYLVASMLADIDWPQTHVIVELGAGTGVITRSINSRRHADSIFFSFEKDDQMSIDLKYRFPDVLIGDDAFRFVDVLSMNGHHQADCVVSGLPFANFKRHEQLALLKTIHDVLRPGGLFIAFQYSLQLQSHLKSVYAKVDCRFVMKNLPPAFIYVCRKHLHLYEQHTGPQAFKYW